MLTYTLMFVMVIVLLRKFLTVVMMGDNQIVIIIIQKGCRYQRAITQSTLHVTSDMQ